MASVERRIDVTDGEAYTREEFEEFYGGLVEWGMAQVAPSIEEEISQALHTAVSIADGDDDETEAAAAELEAERLRQLAAQEERRADEQWRQLMEVQRLREEAAEEAAWKRAQEEREERRRQQRLPKVSVAAGGTQAGAGSSTAATSHTSAAAARDDDEPDAMGWTPREQRLLEAAMRANPQSTGPSGASSAEEQKRRRWEAIASAVPGRSVKEVVARCRSLRQAEATCVGST